MIAQWKKERTFQRQLSVFMYMNMQLIDCLLNVSFLSVNIANAGCRDQ